MYATGIPSLQINFSENREHVMIKPIAVQYPAKYSYDIIERCMLPLIVSQASTIHKMQGKAIHYAIGFRAKTIFPWPGLSKPQQSLRLGWFYD